MKLNKLNIPNNITQQSGIEEINIKRLNSVVALIGRNGSGKTRILNLFEQNLQTIFSINRFLDNSISNPPKNIEKVIKDLLPFKDYLLVQEKLQLLTERQKAKPNDTEIKEEINVIQKQVKRFRIKLNQKIRPNPRTKLQELSKLLQSVEPIIQTLRENYFRRINNEEIRQLQEVISETKNDKSVNFEDLIETVAENINYNEINSIYKSGLKFLIKLPHQLTYDYMDCMGEASKYEKRVSHKRFILLNKLFKDFLNKDLKWERKSMSKKITDQGVQSLQTGTWKLDGRVFNYHELSDGEKTLFTYLLLFFLLEQNPNLRLKESIIVIDEPELHLHPDSEIDLIKGIRSALTDKGQLWIATHSINILSDLNFDEIFMVRKGNIKHPSRTTPGESLLELMSIEDRISKLSNFLSISSEWAYVNFMAQCFTDPEVIQSSKQNDPQVISFKEAINKKLTGGNNMLLDFGAGKGRLFEHIISDNELLSKLNYSALEPEKELHKDLKVIGVKIIYQTYKELPENTFNFVVLCNVLHEIPIMNWVSIFNKIIKSINETGFLMIIEDKLLPKGERIGEVGYLVLDIEEIQTLFNLKETPISFVQKDNADRILGVAIPKKVLTPLKKNNLIKCMEHLENSTLKKIEELRKIEKDNINNTRYGRISGFYSQLHINSKLAQKILTKP